MARTIVPGGCVLGKLSSRPSFIRWIPAPQVPNDKLPSRASKRDIINFGGPYWLPAEVNTPWSNFVSPDHVPIQIVPRRSSRIGYTFGAASPSAGVYDVTV